MFQEEQEHGTMSVAMEILLVVVVPLSLLGLMLAMERVERPFRERAAGADLESFLGNAQPEEVEVFVRDGFAAALDRHWSRRRRLSRLRPPQAGTRRRLGDQRRRGVGARATDA